MTTGILDKKAGMPVLVRATDAPVKASVEPSNAGDASKVLDAIKKKIRIINAIAVLATTVTLLLLVRFSFSIINYIPFMSVVALLTITGGLFLLGVYMARSISETAIKDIEGYSSKLHWLLYTSKVIHETYYSDTLYKKVLDISKKITRADTIAVLLNEGNRLVVKVIGGGNNGDNLGRSFPNDLGISGWVMKNGSALRLDNVQKDDRYCPEADDIAPFKTKSVLCVPLTVDSATIGVLELFNAKQGAFSLQDEEIASYVAEQAAISIEKARFFENEKNYRAHITNILGRAIDSMAEKRGHSKRVTKYALMLANALDFSENRRERLYRAALLHDIGFLYMNRETMTLNQYRSHVIVGYKMMQPITFYEDISQMVLYHHEKYDGSGYPSGLKGDAIPLESRIIAIAEAFDVMYHRDSYKAVGDLLDSDVIPTIVGFQDALDEIKRNAGIQFDPHLVELFLKIITESIAEAE